MPVTDKPFILPLTACTNVALAGGKAVNLGILLRGGFAVPDGFVITTAASAVPLADVASAITAAYRAMGGGAVAVRSSATAEDMAGASMAGQYDTFLHVHDEASLLDAVGRCRQSLLSDRTVTYLAGHGIDPRSVAMAVVVQRLVRAEVAGVLFTANPHTGSRDEMLIEATWGLGETLVSGRVQPDVLRMARSTGTVLEQRVGDKRIMIAGETPDAVEVPEDRRQAACLSEADVQALWKLGLAAADHFCDAQDIEWAIEGGRLYLLQSRPITTLHEADARQQALAEARRALHGAGPWVRHNLGETLPHPTPLTWSIIQPFMTGDGGFGWMYRKAGFDPSPDVCRHGFLALVAGRIYMDASRAAGVFFDRFPYRYDLELLRDNPDAAQSPPTVPAGSIWQRWRADRRIATVHRRLAGLAKDFDRDLRQRVFPAFGDYCAAERAKDLPALSATELAECWRSCRRAVMDEFAPQSLLPSLIEGMALADLRQFLAEQIWDEDAAELATALASSPVPNMTLLADAGLYDVATGKRTIDHWLKQFGHRAAGEFELSVPRWIEQPDLVRTMAERLAGRNDPMALHEAHAAAVRQKASEIRARLSASSATEFDRLLDLVWRYIVFREDGKYFLMLGYALLRDVAMEIGRRIGVGDGVFFLSEQEMLGKLNALPHADHPGSLTPAGTAESGAEGGQDPDHLRSLVSSRQIRHRAEAWISLPHVIAAGDIHTLGVPPPVVSEGVHRAFAVSTGVASGPAKIVQSPTAAGDLGAGYVLVCPSTDPNWTPLFVNAAALVLECGGTLSHGAVVAREMGLPAVVLPDATRLFADGQQLRVDGHHGNVGPADAPATRRADPVLPYDGGAVNPNATRIEPTLLPPPPGPQDRRAARYAKWSLLVWGIYLLLAFLLPERLLYQPSLRLIDAVVWPLVPAVGKVLTVAIVAAGVALATMALQRVLTDNRRLKEAKRRSNVLSKQAAALPAHTPRLAVLRQLSANVQGRLLLAAMIPMAVLLGPLVMIFLWFPARMDPASWNAAPGTVVQVEAVLTDWATGEARIEVPAPLRLDAATPAAQPISDPSAARSALREMLTAWEASTAAPPTDAVLADQIEQAKSRGEASSNLRRFLASGSLPPRPIRWTIRTPEAPGAWPIAVRGPDGSTAWMKIVVGDAHPPAPTEAAGDDAPIRSVKLVYERAPQRPFWTPLAAVTWQPIVHRQWNHWDAGWLITYLLAYLPAMWVWRRVLGVP